MDNVSQTLFYPLFGRAQASDRWPELFPDPWAHKAMEIAAQEGTTAQPMDGFPELVYGLRHMILVQEARAYLETHPGAAVVNIGCGLTSSSCGTGGCRRPTTRLICPTPPPIMNG